MKIIVFIIVISRKRKGIKDYNNKSLQNHKIRLKKLKRLNVNKIKRNRNRI